MKLTCKYCGKIVSDDIPENIIIAGIIECFECSETKVSRIEGTEDANYVDMEQSEIKADRNHRSQIQEQDYVKNCRDPAFHVEDGRDTDCIVFRHGFIEIVDNKFSDDDVFYISKDDISKGLDIVKRLTNRNHNAKFSVDFWFPRHKLRRIIHFDETCREYSTKVWVANKRIMTRLANWNRE